MSSFSVAKEIRDNFAFCLENSLKNCHAFGVHSVVLGKDGGKFRRVFVARDWHQLWKNEIHSQLPFYTLSVAIHPHHCDLKLTTLKGRFTNYEFSSSDLRDAELWRKYHYISPIGGNEGKFIADKMEGLRMVKRTDVETGESVEMSAVQMHTVFVEPKHPAAWLVEEGEENPFYDAVCFSNDRLEFFNFNGMYKPMSPKTLSSIVDYLEAK